jgi:hypothetical protein
MGSGSAREIKVPLLLLPVGEYAATFVRDDETKPDAVKLERGRVRRSNTLTIKL